MAGEVDHNMSRLYDQAVPRSMEVGSQQVGARDRQSAASGDRPGQRYGRDRHGGGAGCSRPGAQAAQGGSEDDR